MRFPSRKSRRRAISRTAAANHWRHSDQGILEPRENELRHALYRRRRVRTARRSCIFISRRQSAARRHNRDAPPRLAADAQELVDERKKRAAKRRGRLEVGAILHAGHQRGRRSVQICRSSGENSPAPRSSSPSWTRAVKTWALACPMNSLCLSCKTERRSSRPNW